MQTQVEPETAHLTTVPESGTSFGIQVTNLRKGEKDIITEPLPFQQITDSIESVARAVLMTLERVKPRKASVEFGVEFAISEGKLIAFVVKGDTVANMKITLEWGEMPALDGNGGEQSQ